MTGCTTSTPQRGAGGGGAWVAFYAPMKPPDHPRPSGDRRIARLTMAALAAAGLCPRLVSTLRVLDLAGDAALQDRLFAAARAEVDRLVGALAVDRPVAWLTYHCHHRAPDLIGPAVAAALDLPYLVTEASISPRRREGPWARFAAASEQALRRADRVFWTTPRDRPALEAAGLGPRLGHLPAFVEIAPVPAPRPARRPLRLLTVAMMRPGDKAESYRRLAAGLARLDLPWELTVAGDGSARAACLGGLGALGPVTHRADLTRPEALRPLYAAADLLVWPGVREGVGMVWLEAQAAGLPVVAEDGPAARAVIGGGMLAPPDAPRALAEAIAAAAADRLRLSIRAAAHAHAHHSLDAAARTLAAAIRACAR